MRLNLDPSAQPEQKQWDQEICFMKAVALARHTIAQMTELPIDSVSSAKWTGEEWRILVDVVESAARMGENDFLATYELAFTGSGEIKSLNRTQRYRREG